MRVALISEHASPAAILGAADAGGQNVHVAELSAALARLGHDVRVYTRREQAAAPDEAEYALGVTVVHVPVGPVRPLAKDELLPYMRQFGCWLADEWRSRRWRPDVVHAHFWMSGLAALVATGLVGADPARVPVVLTFHALGSEKLRHQRDADTSPRQRIGLERMLGNRVDRVIAQCRHEVTELIRLGVPRAAIRVVPSGVDTEMFAPAVPGATVDAPRPRVLSVGRLVPRKGFDQLVGALPWVPDAELVIAGGPPAERLDDDPEAARLSRLAADLGVADRLRLLGSVPRPEMPGWYRSSAVVGCTPWYEPFGLTPLEAMACGVPVVAYAVGGLAESVVDQVTGVLVAPRNVRALGLTLRRLLSDEALRMSYASAGVDRARSRYAWSRTAAEADRVYAEVTGLVPADISGAEPGRPRVP